MPYSQYSLIGPFQTLNDGRNEINQAYSGLTVNWSGSVGSNSIIRNNIQGNLGNIATGAHSMAGGKSNTASGNYSIAFWGSGNSATVSFAAVFSGLKNTTAGAYSFIGGGKQNVISSGAYSSIISGSGNTITNGPDCVVQGLSNVIGSVGVGVIMSRSSSGSNSQNIAIIGGKNNQVKWGYNLCVNGGTDNIVGFNGVPPMFGSPTLISNSSIIGGNLNYIFGSNSFVGGGQSNVVNSSNINNSILGGQSNNISGTSIQSSIIGGKSNRIPSSNYSTILGGQSNVNLSSVDSSIVGGNNNIITTTSGAIIAGFYNTANGNCSAIIAGKNNLTTGRYSAVIAGTGNQSGHYGSVALGGGATTSGSFQLMIGNQYTNSPLATNNAIRLDGALKKGYAYGGWIATAADYAEYFEWADENIDNENRLGYFVSLVDNKIEMGNSNIIGIISSVPGFVGDCPELSWTDMFAKDVWSIEIKEPYKKHQWKNPSKISETITVFEDAHGNKFSSPPNPGHPKGVQYVGNISVSATTEDVMLQKMNPDFNPDVKYIPRSERKEWAPVGLLGKIRTRTAEIITGKKISVNSQGMAVNGDKYDVLEIVRPHTQSQYGIVKILFK